MVFSETSLQNFESTVSTEMESYRDGLSQVRLARNEKLLAGLTILLIDDTLDMRKLFSLLLSRAGARVVSASSAEEAWALLEVSSPHVIVSDIAMPEEDGIAFIRRFRKEGPPVHRNLPAVAITAFSSAEWRNDALKAGFHAFLCKTAPSHMIIQTVSRVVGKDPTQVH